jgi:flagellin
LSDVAGINIMHVDEALEFVNSQRASVGASISRLDSITSTLSSRAENLAASRSRVEDADYATETFSLAKTKILHEAATAMIAQANASPRMILSLLR